MHRIQRSTAPSAIATLATLATTVAATVAATLAALITQGNTSIALAQSPSTEDMPSNSCLVGYPEAPESDDRAVSRYEFASTLNLCLNTLEDQLELELENAVPRSEVEATTQRQQELNTELEGISDRLDELMGSPERSSENSPENPTENSPNRLSTPSEGQSDEEI